MSQKFRHALNVYAKKLYNASHFWGPGCEKCDFYFSEAKGYRFDSCRGYFIRHSRESSNSFFLRQLGTGGVDALAELLTALVLRLKVARVGLSLAKEVPGLREDAAAPATRRSKVALRMSLGCLSALPPDPREMLGDR